MIELKGGSRDRGEREGESSPIFPMPDFPRERYLQGQVCKTFLSPHERKSKIE